MNSIHHEKEVGIFPLLWGFCSDLAKNFTGSLFPVPHPSTKSCPNPSSFRGVISENAFQTHDNISVKPVRFSPTIIIRNRGCITDMELSSAGGHVVENTINI